jgi:hypothetical protein
VPVVVATVTIRENRRGRAGPALGDRGWVNSDALDLVLLASQDRSRWNPALID